jgi:hypothetical protein
MGVSRYRGSSRSFVPVHGRVARRNPRARERRDRVRSERDARSPRTACVVRVAGSSRASCVAPASVYSDCSSGPCELAEIASSRAVGDTGAGRAALTGLGAAGRPSCAARSPTGACRTSGSWSRRAGKPWVRSVWLTRATVTAWTCWATSGRRSSRPAPLSRSSGRGRRESQPDRDAGPDDPTVTGTRSTGGRWWPRRAPRRPGRETPLGGHSGTAAGTPQRMAGTQCAT